jgi:formate dehydrogenase iron-sulfur subunit
VACKHSNELPAERTRLEQRSLGFQNPDALSAKTFTVVTNREVEDARAPGGLRWVFSKRSCMHCKEPACASACPVTALHKEPDGPVTYDAAKCLGCRYCVWACPFGVPTAEWDSLAPRIRKCTMCFDRLHDVRGAVELNGQAVSPEAQGRIAAALTRPACVSACPTGALMFGEREELLAEARKRMAAHPDRYVPHIYGEREVGGTSVLFLASVPFEKLGFRIDLGEHSYPSYSAVAMGAVPPAVIAAGGLLAGIYYFSRRRAEVQAQKAKGKQEAPAKTAGKE